MSAMAAPHCRDLAVVIPVYNEEACIGSVVDAWRVTLGRLGIDYGIIVLDDGSRDGTAGVLAGFEDDDRVRVVTKTNSGHGPTILRGYRMAVESAEWVFQCDGDDEMEPSHFDSLWQVRDEYDALFGSRIDREQSTGRSLISRVSRTVVRTAYSPGVVDVNTPYRLMRSSLLAPIVTAIPDSTFAPNLIIAGTFAASDARIVNIPVPHRNRRTGAVSIVRWRLWKAAGLSLIQTVRLAPRMRSVAREISEALPATGGPS